MTREEILKSFAADSTFKEKTQLNDENITQLRFSEKSSSKLVEVIKLAIDGVIKDESEPIIARRIQMSLNK